MTWRTIMKKILVVSMLFFIASVYAQSNFNVGLNSGLIWQYQTDNMVGLIHNVKVGYSLSSQVEIYATGGFGFYGKRRNDMMDTYITNFNLGIKYYFGSDDNRFFILGEVQKTFGDHIDYIRHIETNKAGNYFNTFKSSLNMLIAVFGAGYSIEITKSFEFDISAGITLVSTADDDVHYIRLLTGFNYRL